MRERGLANLDGVASVVWTGGRAEALPLRDASCGLVTFGSSFNVVDRRVALVEAARVLAPGGRLACLWNHRDLDDPLQRRIETCIRSHLPAYAYGARRRSQRAVIAASGYFRCVRRCEVVCARRVSVAEWTRAWRSHLTLRRQAGPRFADVLAAIAAVVAAEGRDPIAVPYVTRVWLAERV